MHTRVRTLAVAPFICLLVASCSRELKPDHQGVFAASGGRLQEIPPLGIDTEFTAEGYMISYFSGDPAVTARASDVYFILYGDYKVFDLKAYQRKGDRFEIDSSKGGLADQLEAGGMKGEPEMTKCRLAKPLPVGTYVLEVQQAGETMHFPFRLE